MLPVEAVLPDLLAALERSASAVLVAPPGAGKTTRAPPALLGAPWRKDGRILLLSPRRIAARAAAARMASERGERVGDMVGYRVRLETRVSAQTRIEVVTEGVFTRMILNNPSLEGIAAVIFDEFHERSLEGDLGLALARDAQQGLREDLRILVMSATLDAARVASLLGDAPVIESQGRMFPVVLRYRARAQQGRLEDEVAAAARAIMREEPGSALIFLPGAREIERTAEALRANGPDFDIRPLYGAMDPRAQDAAIAPAPDGRRKIVLATSIAETSLTIEGVRIVIDAGLARRPRFEPGIGLAHLETVRASQAAIAQRTGRAGRVEPGVCLRLWDEGETRALPAYDRPEILDSDLSALALDLASWGVRDPATLAWLDPPPRAAWEEAVAALTSLGALDQDGRLTPHGAELAQMPLPPRLAHMVAAAGEDAALAARIAMLLTEQGLGGRDVDLRARLTRFAEERGQRADAARRLAHRIGGAGVVDPERVGFVLARGFPDRIAKKRGGARADYLMANGRAVSLNEADPLARETYLVIADASGRADRVQALAAAAIEISDVEALFADRIEITSRVALDPSSGAVRARKLRRLGRITLSEAPLEQISQADIEAALLDAVRSGGLSVLPWDEQAEQLRARVAFMRSLEGDAWPDWSDAALLARLEDWLPVSGARRFADFDLSSALSAFLGYDLLRTLDAAAPARFETPAGSSLRIDYGAEGGPALDVRLQEMFGLTAHPCVGHGRAPLTLRLLSPAHRSVQTTKDLPGFWSGSYAAVRADMRGRYPKHPWPDDPANAPPTRRAKPRGS